MKYRLIVSDVDGTLFPNGNRLSSETIDLVHRYQQSGGIFTIATGRMKKAIDPFIDELKIRCPVIVYNGAHIVNPITNRIMVSHHIDPVITSHAVSMVERFDLDAVFHTRQQSFVRAYTPAITQHIEKIGIRSELQEDLSSLARELHTKILVMGDSIKLSRFSDALSDAAGNDFESLYSENNYLEILPKGVSKGNALKEVAHFCCIPMHQVLAIGDERNDVSMIQAAGLGVAVANAHIELLQMADWITVNSWNLGVEEVLRNVLYE